MNTKHLNFYEINCLSAKQLAEIVPAIKHNIETYGFCVLNAWDNSVEAIKTVAALFGTIQNHIRANSEGIVGEGEPTDKEWRSYKAEYQGTTSEEFLPHTDGSFLHGLVSCEGKLSYIGPPKIMLLQCVAHAVEGGENIIVDSKKIIEDIVIKKPELAKIIFKPGCVTFCRDNLLAMDFPVYEKCGNNLRVRFRYDFATYAPSWSYEAIRTLHNEYHLNPKYRTVVDLQPGQILIVDNFRVLHARNAFKVASNSNAIRKLRRVWIKDDSKISLTNISKVLTQHRALQPFHNYLAIKNSASEQVRAVHINTGIILSKKLSSFMDEIRLPHVDTN